MSQFPAVTLYTHNPTLAKQVEESVSPCEVKTHRELSPPKFAHAVVTLGSLNAKLERFAAQLRCYPVVLPEASRWLGQQCLDGKITVIIVSDMVKIRI